MQAMSITVQSLQAAGAGVTTSFPAQVVVPQGGERIVSAPVVSLVEQVLVQSGQSVRPGTPLLRIASTELGQAQLLLSQAGIRARLAQQNLAREQSLFAEGIIPERRVQEAKAAWSQAQAEVSQARAALRLMGLSNAVMDRLGAGGQAQDGLTLTAPQAGIVTDIAVHAGQRVEASTMLLRLVQATSRWRCAQRAPSQPDSARGQCQPRCGAWLTDHHIARHFGRCQGGGFSAPRRGRDGPNGGSRRIERWRCLDDSLARCCP
jgi:cobalt-zinc-cadmium efflux system membrane fusion protein